MNYRYHHRVQRDVNDAMAFYERHASEVVADDFFEELLNAISKAAENPTSHHFLKGSTTLRRVNLKRFPFHFLHEIRSGHIYIVVVRHHKRHPKFGLRRKR